MTEMKIFEAKRLSKDLIAMVFNGVTRDLWSRGKLRGHPRECWKCHESITPGTEAFRPLGNHVHRMQRLCVSCANTIAPMEVA